MPLQPGALLYDRYRIESVLGHGGMGAVYLATDQSLGLHCALKENLNVSPDSERQFKREATLLATLRHPNLPRVTNHFVIGDQQYLVMDFVEGEDLKQRLAREGPLAEADVMRWALQVCDALVYLHGRTPPVIHRDIKPANIRLTKSGDAMLVDFGIAKSSESGQKTTTGAVAFTPGFAPPEQYGMGRTDQRTDEYALAATLYSLLTGQTPPDSLERLMNNVPLAAPDQLRPDLSAHVAQALTKALEPRPENRFPNALQFKKALEGKEEDDGDATLQQRTRLHRPETAAVAEKPAGRRWFIIPALLGGLLVLGGIGLIGFGLIAPKLLNPLNPTSTLPPTARVVASATENSGPKPVDATATPTEAPLPTDTATPEPPTAPPTAIGTPLGAGPRVAFISNRDGKFFQIYSMNPDGSDVQQLTFDERNKWDPNWNFNGTQLAWSTDGTHLVYVADGGPNVGLDLWMMNADGTNQIDITQLPGDDYNPAWCGKDQIAYTSTRSADTPEVYVLQLGGRPSNVSATHDAPREYDPTWSPDCKYLIFASYYNGPLKLYRYFFDGSSFRPVRDRAPDRPDEPAISPDGQYLAYTLRTSRSNEVFAGLVTDRFSDQQLTTTLGNSEPQWSPDSKWLVFVSTRDGNREIYRMTAAGANQTNLTNNAAVDIDPVWQPVPQSATP